MSDSSRHPRRGASKRRFLLVTLDAAGNWPPEVVLIRALVQRGHEVRVISNANHAGQIREAGAKYRPYQYAPQRNTAARHDNQRETEMARVLRDVFLNPAFCDELLAEVERDAPDVLLVDHMLMTAAAGAESTGLPTAILWHTVLGAMADSPLLMGGSVLDPLNAFREKMGLARVADRWGIVERADAILAFTYQEFDSVPPDAPRQLHYVGPLGCVPQRLPVYSLPWAQDDARPLILVSYSTSFQDQVRTLQRIANAVAGLPARVLLTLGEAISADELQLPDNVVPQTFVPHAAVLPHASLVVTHAGHGTVMAAITAGVPLICTPMGRDQHVVSGCVERRGLGLVASATASPEELRSTIVAALKDDALRARARNFAAGLDVEAGLHRAIAVLEDVRLH
jgi:MGT family glycosyltransferase